MGGCTQDYLEGDPAKGEEAPARRPCRALRFLPAGRRSVYCKKEPPMNMKRVIIVASASLYALACLLPAFREGHQSFWQGYPGWYCLLFGWMGIFLHAWPSKLFYLAWLGNAAYSGSMLCLLLRKNGFALALGAAALLAALCPLLVREPEMVINESGTMHTIEGLRMQVGYWLWAGALALVPLGALMLRRASGTGARGGKVRP